MALALTEKLRLELERYRNKDFLKAVTRSADDARLNHRCLVCHNEDNDPHFKWETYWPNREGVKKTCN